MTKTCGTLPGDTTGNERIWPGMFMNTISRYGKTDVIQKGTNPSEPGTVLCPTETCAGEDADDSYWESELPPWPPKVGDVKAPEALTPPEGLIGIELKEFVNAVAAAHSRCKDFIIPDDLSKYDSALLEDDEGTTHVYIKGDGSANLRGKKVSNGTCKSGRDRIKRETNPSIKIVSGPIRLYIDAKVFHLNRNTWIDTSDLRHPADFMILGTQKDTRQLIQVSSEWPEGQTLKTFIWMPTGDLHFFRTSVESIEGAIWGRDFKRTCNAAICERLSITVPEDMPSLIFQRLGEEFAIGRRDFFAQGITNWRTYSRLIK